MFGLGLDTKVVVVYTNYTGPSTQPVGQQPGGGGTGGWLLLLLGPSLLLIAGGRGGAGRRGSELGGRVEDGRLEEEETTPGRGVLHPVERIARRVSRSPLAKKR